MASTITRTQVRQGMLHRVPILGRAGTADSLVKSPPSLTHMAEFERQRAGLTSFESQYIHRYNLPDPDRWRLITTLNQPTTDGIINLDGPAYVDNGDKAYERLWVHPDDLNFAIAEGQRRQKVLTNIALVRGHDGDMELGTNNVDYWGGGAVLGGSFAIASVPIKITSDVRSGTQALQVTTSNATNLIWGEQHRVTPGRQVYLAILFRATTLLGSFTFSLRDAQNAVYIGTRQVISGVGGGGWIMSYVQATVPANCNLIQAEFQTSSAGDVYIVDTCFGPYQAGQTEYPLQAAFNEAYKLRFVRPSRFVYALSTPGFFDADSIEFVGDLTTPEDWNAEIFRRDVNSNRLRFVANSYNNRNAGWGHPNNSSFMSANMRPIWLAMEAQVSDFEPLLTEASTTSQPLDECVCYSLRSLFETLVSREPHNPAWPPLLAEYAAWSAAESIARPPQARMPPQRLHQIRA
jgi:hypothetical protein